MNTSISEIMSTQIIPVLLLPVTGLLALVFYNRISAINQRIRTLQKELRDILVEPPSKQSNRMQEMIFTLHSEVHFLHKRAHWIWISLICCLLSVGVFSLCALFIALGIFFTWAIHVALIFWFFGPIFICMGASSGLCELILSNKTTHIQSLLVEKWQDEDF